MTKTFKSTPLRTAIRTALALPLAAASICLPVSAIAQNEQAEIEEIVVTGVTFNYLESQSSKMNTPVRDLSQTVLTITEDLYDFAGITKFEDIYKLDASGGSSHAGDQFPRNYYRGIRQTGVNTIKVDGFRLNANMELDLAAFERIEVIKGATSTIYGQSPVGGTLNAITKKPQAEFGGSVSLEAGSFDHVRGDIDLYGPLTADGALTYRFIGAHKDSNSFVDYAYDQKLVIAPSLQYEFSEDTLVRLSANYQANEFLPLFGVGSVMDADGISNPRLPDVPRSRLGNATWGQAEKEALFVRGMLEHEFENDWTLRASTQYNKVDAFLVNMLSKRSVPIDGELRTGTTVYHVDAEDEVYSGEVNIFGDVEVFGRDHTVFLGVDHAVLPTQVRSFFDSGNPGGTAFNIEDPDYSIFPVRRSEADWQGQFQTGFEGLFQEQTELTTSGVTLQTVLRPHDNLDLNFGARYSRDELSQASNCCGRDDTLPAQDKLSFNNVTLQAGAVYRITDQINAYASYGETFEPQTGTNALTGGALDPEEGRVFEIGIKGEAFDNNVLWTLAAFDILRSNMVIPAGDGQNAGLSLPVGSQVSTGVEFDARGELLPGWNVFLSVAFLDSEYEGGKFDGAKPIQAPDFGLSFFTSYQFEEGELAGLGIGGGVVHKSGRASTNINDRGGVPVIPIGAHILGDFTEVDLRAFYDHDNWRLYISATNLTNELYYSGQFEQVQMGLSPNPARTIKGGFTYNF
jgi:iron complex outermembrane receptor protein